MVDFARLHRDLDCYLEPDTSLDPIKHLSAGSYEVLTIKSRFPDSSTDYIQLRVPELAEEVAWICARWRNRTYATINEGQEVDVTASEAVDVIPELALVRLLPEFTGYEYSLKKPRYPFPLPGVPNLPLEPPPVNNCCTFVEALLVKAWFDIHGARKSRPPLRPVLGRFRLTLYSYPAVFWDDPDGWKS